MFCPRCGTESPDTAKFCQACGYQLKIHTLQKEEESETKSDDGAAIWFYKAGNQQKGPVTETMIADLVRDGIIDKGSLIKKDGDSGWYRAEFTDLAPIFETVVPVKSAVPVAEISDKWLWALAAVPIPVSMMLSNIVPSEYQIILTVLVLALNIVFLTEDAKHLNSAGINIGNWLWLGFILVPLYLFVRGVKTTKNIIPGIVWCLLFEISFFI